MTNKEALTASVPATNLPDITLEKALLDQDVTPGDTYSKEKAESIDLATIDVLKYLLSVPNVSEGGYSVSFDRAAVQKRLDDLNGKYNLATKPTVRARPIW